jgi:hypothetical protein
MVTDENGFSINWGVGLGWNLDQALEEPNDPVPADLSAYSTVTVGLEVNTVATYRVRLDFGDASNYCVASVTNGSNTLDLRTDFVDECWAGGAATPLDPSLLSSVVALHIQVPTWLDTETPYDFCVTEVSFQ